MRILPTIVKEIKAYLYMRNKVNKKILDSELREDFNYSSNTSIYLTRIHKYLVLRPRTHGLPTLYEVLDKIYVPKEYKNYKKGKYICPLTINGKIYYLIPKRLLPWWLLEEFGGPLKDTPDDFIKYLEESNIINKGE
ncbi:MAG: hypothetical protein PVG65_05240 [Candidatus Thorarchaeota archaeon]|jgi:hypothetical protein